MKLLPLETLHLPDSSASRFQDNLTNFTAQLSQLLFLKGSLIAVGVTTSPQKVEHKLGVKPSGYIVLGQNAPGSIYSPEESTDKFITFQASANLSANIWVF